VRGAATANERSPSDVVIRGTATEPDVADLRPALAVTAADGVMESAGKRGSSLSVYQYQYQYRATFLFLLF